MHYSFHSAHVARGVILCATVALLSSRSHWQPQCCTPLHWNFRFPATVALVFPLYFVARAAMSRDQRASLLDNDDLGSSAGYSNMGGAGAQRDEQSSGTLSSWWRNPRKRLYMIGISLTVLIFIIAIAIFAVMSKGKNDEPDAVHSSSSSTGGTPALSSNSGGELPSSTSIPSGLPTVSPTIIPTGLPTGLPPDSTGAAFSSSSSSSAPPLPPYNPETPWLFPRLPNSTFPSHYQLQLMVDLQQFTFSGSVDINVSIVRPVDHIVLHSVLLEIQLEVTVTLDDGTVLSPVAWFYTPNQYVVLNFSSMVAPQRNAVVHLDFNAALRKTSEGASTGLYADYYILDVDPVWMATTRFEPYGARRAFPCFDEPAFKATFDISVKSRNEWPTVLSNMPASVTSPAGTDFSLTVFATTPRISTAYVAIIVADYGNTSVLTFCSPTNPVVLTRVFAPRIVLNYTTIAAQLAASIMQYYCQYFDVSYPVTKQDHVLVRPPPHTGRRAQRDRHTAHAGRILSVSIVYFDCVSDTKLLLWRDVKLGFDHVRHPRTAAQPAVLRRGAAGGDNGQHVHRLSASCDASLQSSLMRPVRRLCFTV